MKKQILLLAFVSIIGLVSCSKSVKNIISLAEEATFTIYVFDEYGAYGGSGSGFFIDHKGTGISNYHVLDGAVKAFIRTSNGEKYEIDKILGSDMDWDIIKFSIKSNHSNFKYLKFSKSKVNQGDEIYNMSSPLGLERTVSTGIISSLRKDKQHRDIVQITAPISSGSSGSPLLDKNGNVFGVATFSREGGQNLNFGVVVDKAKIIDLSSLEFLKDNQKFNSNSNLYILNTPSDKGSELVLNAIELGENLTTAYFTFTNLNLKGSDGYGIWVELGKKEKGFMIEDFKSKSRYFVTSSTIGTDKNSLLETKILSSTRFKVYLPPIRNKLERFSIYGCGINDNRWVFSDINLNNYRENNMEFSNSYLYDYAFSYYEDGYIEEANDILLDIVYETPSDVIALNALGIISYIADNNNDALYFFGEAIKHSPSHDLSYLNRHVVYNYQGYNEAALEDMNKVVSIDPDQPDNYLYRAQLHMEMENWKKAIEDMDIVLNSSDFSSEPLAYFYRIYANTQLGNYTNVCKDIQIAYSLAEDEDIISQLEELWREFGCR